MSSRSRALAKSWARSLGLDVRRYTPEHHFYEQVESCQIPGLGTLLEFVFGRREDGTFVEVGAYDGVTFSNTWGLAGRGWRGILVEPVPWQADACVQNHREHLGVSVVRTAVGNQVGTLTLHVAGPLSSTDSETFSDYDDVTWSQEFLTDQTLEVPITRLDLLLEENEVAPGFEVLVVDVEGAESAVFDGFDLARWRPDMLIVELADFHPELPARRKEHHELTRSVEAAGYSVAYKDIINTVFVSDEHYSTL